jgi:hypothetical protein
MKRGGLQPTAGFHFTVSPTDTIEVEIEVYAEKVDDAIIPRILNKKGVQDYKDNLVENKAKEEAKLEGLHPESTEYAVTKGDIMVMEQAIAECDKLLSRETVTLHAIFKRPDWRMESTINQHSYIETINGVKWDASAYKRARMSTLLTDWDMAEPDPNDSSKLVKVDIRKFEEVHPYIIEGFLAKLEEKLSFNKDDEKN